MDTVIKLSLVVVCIFIGWRTFKMLKENPNLLNKESLGKSFTTIGILALVLIAFVALMIFSLRR